jgi:hypothetical protein
MKIGGIALLGTLLFFISEGRIFNLPVVQSSPTSTTAGALSEVPTPTISTPPSTSPTPTPIIFLPPAP